MSWQDVFVGAIVVGAMVFLWRKLVRRGEGPKRPAGPDVPASRLVRRKRR